MKTKKVKIIRRASIIGELESTHRDLTQLKQKARRSLKKRHRHFKDKVKENDKISVNVGVNDDGMLQT